MKTSHKTILISIIACLLLAIGGGMGWWLALRNAEPSSDQPTALAESRPGDNPRKVLYWYDPMMPQQHFDKPGKSPFMDMQLIAKYADETAEHNTSHSESAPANDTRKVLYWYDPMSPQQHFDKPGKSPTMDMPLLPKYADSAEGASQKTSGLSINPAVVQSIGARLATVSRIPLSRQIEATGLIAFNDRDVAIVQARSGGFVERVWPLAVGDVVKAGQPLAEILAPGWAAAQQELLAVRGIADTSLLTAARERLRLLGMPENLIKQLERTGAVQSRHTISAPMAGAVQALEVRNGMTIMSGQTLVRINGMSSVWLDVAVPEAQADAVQIGDSAVARLSAFPETNIEGRVAAVLPVLNETSRSIRVRIELKNPRQQLRPGLSAQVRLSSSSHETALAIPTEALIRTGKRTLVILAGDQGRYTPQEVAVDHEIGNQTVVTAGLEEGQQVVSSGQFLIDSEASLNSIEDRPATTGHQHIVDGAP